MKIHNECSFLKQDGIVYIEQKYNAKYVFESCLKGKNGWLDFPAAIFYTDVPHPKGSNYFALYVDESDRFMITNGISAIEPFSGIQIDENVYYSRYCHDYRDCGPIAIDGGRDYTKLVGDVKAGKRVTIQVNKDHLELVDDG